MFTLQNIEAHHWLVFHNWTTPDYFQLIPMDVLTVHNCQTRRYSHFYNEPEHTFLSPARPHQKPWHVSTRLFKP